MFQDLALNLIAEFIGILVTIFLIDRILRSREERKSEQLKRNITGRIVMNYVMLLLNIVGLLNVIHHVITTGRVHVVTRHHMNINVDSLRKIKKNLLDLVSLAKDILSVRIVDDMVTIDAMLEREIDKWNLYFSDEKTIDPREIELAKLDVEGLLELANKTKDLLRGTPETKDIYGDDLNQLLVPYDLSADAGAIWLSED